MLGRTLSNNSRLPTDRRTCELCCFDRSGLTCVLLPQGVHDAAYLHRDIKPLNIMSQYNEKDGVRSRAPSQIDCSHGTC